MAEAAYNPFPGKDMQMSRKALLNELAAKSGYVLTIGQAKGLKKEMPGSTIWDIKESTSIKPVTQRKLDALYSDKIKIQGKVPYALGKCHTMAEELIKRNSEYEGILSTKGGSPLLFSNHFVPYGNGSGGAEIVDLTAQVHFNQINLNSQQTKDPSIPDVDILLVRAKSIDSLLTMLEKLYQVAWKVSEI